MDAPSKRSDRDDDDDDDDEEEEEEKWFGKAFVAEKLQRALDIFAKWTSILERREWTEDHQKTAEDLEIEGGLRGHYDLTHKLRMIVVKGRKLLITDLLARNMHGMDIQGRAKVVRMEMWKAANTILSVAQVLSSGRRLNTNDVGVGVWGLDAIEYLTRGVIQYTLKIRRESNRGGGKEKEKEEGGSSDDDDFYKEPPYLFETGTPEDKISWLARGIPRGRLLNALLNALLVQAWTGANRDLAQNHQYRAIVVLVSKHGSKKQVKALEAANALARLVRKAVTSGKKRRLLSFKYFRHSSH